jgi:hypothetical protein
MDKSNLKYRKVVDKYGEYYLPDFGQFDEDTGESESGCEADDKVTNGSDDCAVSDDKHTINEGCVGRYAYLRKQYLKEHKRVQYTNLITHGELRGHLIAVEREAREFRECVVPEMAKRYGVTENLKSIDPMKWVGLMNNIRAAVDEMIFSEIIYI